MSTEKQSQNQTEILISSISEDLLLLAYQKEAAMASDIFNTKVKHDTLFYITVYYKGELVRSRTISTHEHENNRTNEEFQRDHFENLKILINKPYLCTTFSKIKGENKIYGIKLGETIIMTSSLNFNSAQLFCYIIAGTFVLNKAVLLIKEAGCWADLLKLAQQEKPPYAYGYLNKINLITGGYLGGYH